jgi:hypothetical protein
MIWLSLICFDVLAIFNFDVLVNLVTCFDSFSRYYIQIQTGIISLP